MAEKKQSDIYNVIGKNIKKYRKRKGLKQRELAEALYLSDSFIAKLESITHQTISIDTLEETTEIVENKYSKILLHPAAKTNHHEYAGGLLHHEVSMLDLAKAIANLYPTINKDLLYAGLTNSSLSSKPIFFKSSYSCFT